MATIGSARIDERGKATGGQKGDQKQTSTPDFKGEVARQDFYVSKQGWIILRPKDRTHAEKIAYAMIKACDNPNVGYSQSDRYAILADGTASKRPTNCDCTSLVRECVKEGTGKDPGDFYTGNEVQILMKTGLFDQMEYVKGMVLLTGDILVTKAKGHTVIVTSGDKPKTIREIAQEVIDGMWGSGQDRRNRLHAAGYDYAEVQAEVNRMLAPKVEHISQRGLDFIAKKEGGYKLTAYHLAGEKYWTIGVGHYGPDVKEGMTITHEQAVALFRKDIQSVENYVKKYATEFPLTQGMFDALCSYTYNRGVKGLKQLCDNCHTKESMADGLVKYWGSAERYKSALIKRREQERELFLS